MDFLKVLTFDWKPGKSWSSMYQSSEGRNDSELDEKFVIFWAKLHHAATERISIAAYSLGVI